MSFCTKVNGKVKQILREFNSEIQEHAETALKVTTRLQKILSSPITGIAVAIIPSDIDNQIRNKLLKILNVAIPSLSIVNTCKTAPTLEEKLQCFITHLRDQDPDLQQAILQKLAQLITAKLHDNQLAQNIYDLFVQAQFSIDKK